MCTKCGDLEAKIKRLQSRWDYIKADSAGTRAVLRLLTNGNGAPDDFDEMIDRIISGHLSSEMARLED